MKKITTLLTFTILSVSLFSQLPSYVPTSGLISWYSFSGNPNDSSGHSLNGSITGGVSLTTDRFGNPNSSYLFDGSTGFISVPSNSLLNLSNSYSISGWFNTSSISGSQRTIISQSKTTSQGGLCLNLDNLQNYDVWGDNTDVNGVHSINSNFTPSINTWYNSVETYDGTWLRIYVNGQIKDSTQYTINLSNNLHILTIGSQNVTGTTDYWVGKLDDIGVWNRGLTSTEVLGLYNSHNTTGINSINTNQVSVYPNPTTDNLFINMGNLTGEYSVKVINTLGQVIYQSSIQSVSKVDLSENTKGIYLVEILDNTNSVIETKKVIKIQ